MYDLSFSYISAIFLPFFFLFLTWLNCYVQDSLLPGLYELRLAHAVHHYETYRSNNTLPYQETRGCTPVRKLFKKSLFNTSSGYSYVFFLCISSTIKIEYVSEYVFQFICFSTLLFLFLFYSTESSQQDS